MKITKPEEYFAALAKLGDGTSIDDDDADHEKAVRDYLISLSKMKREQIAVYAPTQELRSIHEDRLNQIRFGGHVLYLSRLARLSGMRRIPRSNDELKTNAALGVAMLQRGTDNAKQRIKEKGRIVQCQECAGWFYSTETERIKPYGSGRYLRFCMPCAGKIKLAKAVYKSQR